MNTLYQLQNSLLKKITHLQHFKKSLKQQNNVYQIVNILKTLVFELYQINEPKRIIVTRQPFYYALKPFVIFGHLGYLGSKLMKNCFPCLQHYRLYRDPTWLVRKFEQMWSKLEPLWRSFFGTDSTNSTKSPTPMDSTRISQLQWTPMGVH